jgi:hypothetical protein
VFRIRKYLLRIRIRGARYLNCGSGLGRPINYGSGRIRILPGHFCGHWKKQVAKKIVIIGFLLFLFTNKNQNSKTDFFSEISLSLSLSCKDLDLEHWLNLYSCTTYIYAQCTHMLTLSEFNECMANTYTVKEALNRTVTTRLWLNVIVVVNI